MSISKKDTKKLWGLAAGRCCFASCDDECIKFIDSSNPTVVGEMAHIIASSPAGPRSNGVSSGSNTYENLILLCPTHHHLVDKAPEKKFPVDLLLKWKREHEAEVTRAFLVPIYNNKMDLCGTISKLLVENRHIWEQWGPESKVCSARQNTVS